MNLDTISKTRAGSASSWFRASRCSRALERLSSVAAVLLAVTEAVAQPGGTVNFGNHSSSKVINGQTSSPVTTNDNVRAALYWSPLGSDTFVQIGAAVIVGAPRPGLIVGGTRTSGAATPGGDSAKFQVRAWGGGYATYEAALPHAGVLIGQSAVITRQTGNPGGAPPSPPGSLIAGGFSGFTLTNNSPSSQPPTMICAGNKTVQCASAWEFDPPTAVDGCTGNNLPVSVLSTVTNGLCPQVATRTWAATNSCDTRFATCSQVVTVEDVVPPVLTCATNKTVECGAAWDFDEPTAFDACCGTNLTLAILSTVTNGDACQTIITRTWQATDCCTNSLTCSQTVTVADTTPPGLTCASNKSVECGAAWDFDPPTASDACSGTNVSVVVYDTTTNNVCPLVVTRTWFATDACGNSNTCAQTVTSLHLAPPVLTCASNKVVNCASAWDFDSPAVFDECGGTNVAVTILSTVTNGLCPLVLTRTWGVTNSCDTNLITCSQAVTIVCPDCPVLVVTKSCPPYPVPSGGTLVWTGSVTNAGDIVVSNVVVLNDQPSPNTVVFGPATLEPGQSAGFSGSYSVPGCSCGPHTDTLCVLGVAGNGIVLSNFVTVSCAGTNVIVPGDTNGDGIVDQAELNVVLANYWAHSPWVYMTNAARLCDGRFQFELTNASAWNFTVLVTTNLMDWTNLPGPAYPVYQFRDPEGTNAPQRFYRLRWP